ncbi:unnamed protein product [Brassica napus]|uniref:(rape) hypothetical protein n=1 Tax=Brassica napus TaxID=3708 RepID=A0A816Q333_BRANA|nr:unnamed protein product [Brassica napus]
MLSLSSDTAVTVNGAKVPQSPDDGFNTALPGVVYESVVSPDPTNVSKEHLFRILIRDCLLIRV